MQTIAEDWLTNGKYCMQRDCKSIKMNNIHKLFVSKRKRLKEKDQYKEESYRGIQSFLPVFASCKCNLLHVLFFPIIVPIIEENK